MSLKTGDIDRMWAKLGFDVNEGKRDVTATLIVAGKRVIRTLRSHGKNKLDGNIPSMIRQQMKLNDEQFSDAVRCPLKRDDYLRILREKKLLDS
jgi:hypothetical protein